MADRTAIGLIEGLVLETMADLGAHPDRPFIKSASIVDAVRARHGIHVGYGYWAMCALTSDWLIPVRLVEGHGNFGSPDYSAASGHFTEARLTHAGVMAVESERSSLPRLPLGLINGDMYAGGPAPSFEPSLVLDALTAAIDQPNLDDDYAAMVGPPVFPTGCSVAGDLAALAAGEKVRLKLSARITVERVPRGPRLIITDLPLYVGPDEVRAAIREQFVPRVDHDHRHHSTGLEAPPGIVDVNDESNGLRTRIACTLRDGADEHSTLREVSELWPVTVERTPRLRAPLDALIRQTVDGDHDAQLDALTRLRTAIKLQPRSQS